MLTGPARYRILQKNITPLNWRKIAALGIPGIYSEPTSERNYPTSTAAASLVGFLRDDGTAGAGSRSSWTRRSRARPAAPRTSRPSMAASSPRATSRRPRPSRGATSG